MKNKYIHYIATLGLIGYLPASGTFATLATLPVVYFLNYYFAYIYLPLTLILISVSNLVIKSAINNFSGQDPKEIVIDEFVGTLVTFLFVPISIKTMVLGFLLFRLFDILKPSPIKKVEKVGEAKDVMALVAIDGFSITL